MFDTDPSELRLVRPKAFYQRRITVNFQDALITLGKATLEGAYSSVEEASYKGMIKELMGFFKEIGLAQTDEEKAYFLIHDAFSMSVQSYTLHCWSEHKVKVDASVWEEFEKDLDTLMNDETLCINQLFFDQPETFLLVDPVKKLISKWYQDRFGKSIDAALISVFPEKFRLCLWEIYHNNKSHYEPIKKRFTDNPFTLKGSPDTSQPISTKVISYHKYDAVVLYDEGDLNSANYIAGILEEKEEFKVWLDKWMLSPNNYHDVSYLDALNQSKTCILIVSNNSSEKWFVKHWEDAKSIKNKNISLTIIPLLYIVNEIPEYLSSNFKPLEMIKFQSLNFNKRPFYELVCAIKGIPPGREFLDSKKEEKKLFIKAVNAQLYEFKEEGRIEQTVMEQLQHKLFVDLINDYKNDL